uniref:Uncharacterized protein n=1 Tax=Oryza barthii TaxID=65489 RepID=A0A0D3ELK3_9ORYZ
MGAPVSPSRAGRAPSHPQVWHECTTPAAGPAHRSPVELSVCVESLLPLHSATAAARMTSMLAVPGQGLGWLTEVGPY